MRKKENNWVRWVYHNSLVPCSMFTGKSTVSNFAVPSLQDFQEGHLYALEKFWAFHQYSGLPKGSHLTINPKVPRLC